MSLKLAYLCLQTTQEGQAAHAHVHEIVGNLRAQGWKVRLAEPEYRDSRSITLLTRVMTFLSVQRRLWALMWPERPSAIYIRNHFAALPTALLARLRNIPVIQEVNGPYEDLFISYPWARKIGPLVSWMFRTQLKLAAGVVVVTPQLGEWVVGEAGRKPIAVIPNGANTDIFHPAASTEHALPDRFVVFFGTLTAWQGIDTILEAVEHADWPAGVDLVVIGDGVLRDRVEAASKRTARVRAFGRLPYREVAGVVARSMAALSPKNDVAGHSKTGLNPLKLFESLACGVPLIATDFPGQSNVVRDGQCGIVIPERDPGALARAVSQLAADPQQQSEMGRRAAELAHREFSWRRRAEQTDEFLRGLLGEVSAPSGYRASTPAPVNAEAGDAESASRLPHRSER